MVRIWRVWLATGLAAVRSSRPQVLQTNSASIDINRLIEIVYRLLLEHGVDGPLIWPVTIRWPTVIYAIGSIVITGVMVGWRRADPARPGGNDMRVFWRAAVVVNLFYLLAGSFWFQSWYVLWVLAPASVLPAGLFTRYVLPWLCFGALCSNVVGDYLPRLPQLPFTHTGRVALAVATIWLPALAAALVVIARKPQGESHE